MRGVVSGAMLVALSELRLNHVFDGIYGTSAGAVNAAYFASGRTWDALAVYYDHLPNGFLGRSRGRPSLKMSFLFDDIMQGLVPLDVDTLRASSIPVIAVVSSLERRVGDLIDLRKAENPIDDLMCGSWLPLLSGPLPSREGERKLDGGMFKPDAALAAIDDGCTHILALNSTPVSSDGHSPMTRMLTRRLLNHWSRDAGDVYFRMRSEWDAERAKIIGGHPWLRGAQILRIAPGPNGHQVERTTVDLGTLLHGLRVGYSTVREEFGCPASTRSIYRVTEA